MEGIFVTLRGCVADEVKCSAECGVVWTSEKVETEKQKQNVGVDTTVGDHRDMASENQS